MAVHQDRAEKERGAKNKFIERTIGVWQSRSRRKLTSEDIRQITENTTGFFRILLEWEANERAPRERKSENLS
jgi:hypothetical protein